MARMPGAVQAPPPRSWTPGRPGPIKWLVIHCTAGAEGLNSAENGAAYDRRRTDGTSCHFFVDTDSVVQEVDTADRAHAARATGNAYGIQVEMCGTYQTREQWLDANSRPMIARTAAVCVWAMREHGIPLPAGQTGPLTPAQLKAGVHGITDHKGITHAFGGTHEDPGPAFPWDVLFDDIRALLNPEDDMAIDYDQKGPPGLPIGAGMSVGQMFNGLMAGANNAREAKEVVARIEAAVKALATAQGIQYQALMAEVDTAEEQAAALRQQIAALPASDPEAFAALVAAHISTNDVEAFLAALGEHLRADPPGDHATPA